MKRYQTTTDAVCGMVLTLGYLACAFVILATIAYYIRYLPMLSQVELGNYLPASIPFAGLFLATFLFRRRMFRQDLFHSSYVALLLYAALAFFTAFGWFQDPMHDIALWFRSHGRWGCFGTGYFFRDSTMPWILFFPLLPVVSTHWLLRRGRLSAKRGHTPVYHRSLRIFAGTVAALVAWAGVTYLSELTYFAAKATVLGAAVLSSELFCIALCGRGFLLFGRTAH